MAVLLQPVQGRITSRVGADRGDHVHAGVDIAAACGTPVVAAAPGRVTAARWSDTAGNMIVIDHGAGLDTRYFHLQNFAVGAGEHVARGQLIGYVGNTGRSRGCHLHWEARRGGQVINPLGATYTPQTGDQLAPLPHSSDGPPVLSLPATFAGFDGETLALGFGFVLLLLIVVRR